MKSDDDLLNDVIDQGISALKSRHKAVEAAEREATQAAKLDAIERTVLDNLGSFVAEAAKQPVLSIAKRARYNQRWLDFTRYCRQHDIPSWPASPQAVAGYLVSIFEQGKSKETVEAAEAIANAHKKLNETSQLIADPLVQGVIRANEWLDSQPELPKDIKDNG